MTQQIITFGRGNAMACTTVEDKPWPSLRMLCEVFDQDYTAQVALVRSRCKRGLGVMQIVDGGYVLDFDAYQAWLFGLMDADVPEEVGWRLDEWLRESLGALRAYWTGGVAVNPRAEDASTVNLRAAEEEVAVLKQLAPLMAPLQVQQWAGQVAAQVQGRKPPEIAPEDRALEAQSYLASVGALPAAPGTYAAEQYASPLGRRVAAKYRRVHGRNPEQGKKFVNGNMRDVHFYTERDRPLFNEAARELGLISR